MLFKNCRGSLRGERRVKLRDLVDKALKTVVPYHGKKIITFK
jgi:hypothetical protein